MKKIPFLHLFLFILTVFSTLIVGAWWALVDPLSLLNEPQNIIKGVPFSASLMIILLSHEFSHYIASKKHGVKATLPYFIPAPTIIGTFGAVIKMKTPIITRKALIDIGASGPIAGFIVSVVVSAIGLHMSEIRYVTQTDGMVIFNFGESMLFYILSRSIVGPVPAGFDVFIHPVAFAGWIGLFVTFLNLMPIGQLDGGHIAYALGGENMHKKTSIIVFIVLLILGLPKIILGENTGPLGADIRAYIDTYLWEGWAYLAVIFFVLFGHRHPPVLQWEPELDPKRRFIGWLTFFIFIITFVPVPIRV